MILKSLRSGHLYAIDQDEMAIESSREKLSKVSDNYTIIKANFANMKDELNKRGITSVDGIVFDLVHNLIIVKEDLVFIMMLYLICEWIEIMN